MSWVSLTIDVAERHAEVVQAVLHAQGTTGLEVRDSTHPIMPQVRAPAPGQAIVVAYFDSASGAKAADQAVRREVKSATTALDDVVERDWSTEWRSLIRSVQVGRLWVGPPWEKANAPRRGFRLFIEPKMAFGTGDHPTTALCLAAVDEWMKANPKSSVLDVGTGTGVLALAAKLLGAPKVVATDNDLVAVGLAKECAAENGLSGVDFSDATLDAIDGTFDLVLANILANTLIELAPLLAKKVSKRLVLAGVLVPQADDVRAAFVKHGLVSVGHVVQGEWIRLDFDAAPKRKQPKPKNPVRARAQAKLKARR